MGKVIKLIKGTLISMVIFLALTAVFGLLLRFTGLSEAFANGCLLVALSLSCAFMGLYTGNLFGRRGLLLGAVSSAILAVLIIVLTALCFVITITPSILSVEFLIPVITGAVFGAIGANMKK